MDIFINEHNAEELLESGIPHKVHVTDSVAVSEDSEAELIIEIRNQRLQIHVKLSTEDGKLLSKTKKDFSFRDLVEKFGPDQS